MPLVVMDADRMTREIEIIPTEYADGDGEYNDDGSRLLSPEVAEDFTPVQGAHGYFSSRAARFSAMRSSTS